MFRVTRMIGWKCTICAGLFPLKHDYLDKPENPEERTDTPMDRLRYMFTLSEYGSVSPELNAAIQSAFIGLFAGALYGGVNRSRAAYLEFIESNQATAFKHHFEAKKLLQDHVTVNFAKGAFSWGWRVGLFTGSIVLVSTSISLYRGKSGILEYGVAGGVSGCLFKINLGMRGMIVGSLLGSVLGTFGGCIIFAFLKATGFTMDEIRSTQYKYSQYRMDKRAALYAKLIEPDDVNLVKCHDEKIKNTSLDALPEPTAK